MAIDLAQVEALAPDQASLDAARKLLKPAAWPTLAADGAGLAWGEAQGSGATPYRVCISEGDAASKCTCPSRKFPCKHALALMWLRAEGKQPFAAAEPPAWVQDWLARRRGPSAAPKPATDGPRASLAAALAPQEPEAAAPDPKAEARAQAQRERRRQDREAAVRAGLDELDLWLLDQLERGISAWLPDAAAACRKMAQRLVDARAGTLATRLDALPSRLYALPEPDRPRAAVEELGLLHLLAEAYRRQERLSPAMQDDIRQMIGWSRERDDLLADPQALRAAGTWHVFATRNVVQPDRLRRLETWLLRNGTAEGPRYGLLLDFVPVAGGATASSLLLDDVIESELVFFGSSAPLRAIVGLQSGPTTQGGGMPPLPDLTLAAAHGEYQAALSARPWLDEWPLAFRDAALRRRGLDFFVVDTGTGLALPVVPDQAAALWALGTTARCDGIGLWDGRRLRLAQAATALGRWVDP